MKHLLKFGSSRAVDEAPVQRIREEQVDAHFRVATFSVSAALAGAVLLVLVVGYVGALRMNVGLLWLAAMAGLGLVHIGLSQIYLRARPVGPRWRFWAFWSSAITLAEGIGWGYAPLGLPQPGDHEARLLVMLTTIGVSAGAVIAYGRYLPTLIIAFVTPNIPYLAFNLFSDDSLLRGSCLLLLLFMGALGRLGLEANRGFHRETSMRIRNEELAEDLQRQKEIAERASIAKSVFLASASHDLRQPIHALGLYVAVLRGLSHTREAEHLIERIETSIGAMDQLFSALLDISRLDAGVVEVHRRGFAIEAFLERICRDFREDALQKGLELFVSARDVVVHSDPVLLERIVRNLMSNAIRYTEEGHVLIRCRRRVGAIALQVWDSGRGIRREHQELVFQEYFQIGNPERDREKGLGLGLAIVRRLTALLDNRLTLRSRFGRGSCFEVVIPLASADQAAAETTPFEEAVAVSRSLLAVVDDEAAIRDAMSKLLKHWGYEVAVAGSGDDLMEELEMRAEAPALIICDYRLRGEENGVELVGRLRARYGAAIPAILITGDTAPSRLAEASASGLLPLHKPVPNGKLRAAIRSLLVRGATRSETETTS